jgi:hypothetical protein
LRGRALRGRLLLRGRREVSMLLRDFASGITNLSGCGMLRLESSDHLVKQCGKLVLGELALIRVGKLLLGDDILLTRRSYWLLGQVLRHRRRHRWLLSLGLVGKGKRVKVRGLGSLATAPLNHLVLLLPMSRVTGIQRELRLMLLKVRL